ncbi:LL-diaminopimelate aminotransferase [Pseudoclavibacter triregionum]|nr:LL-diaminopimelate aminotransferase [Pseudoclavibacter triregionum]
MTLGPLPEYPWDELAPIIARAKAHPAGAVDLSIGSPVDPTPEVVRRALADAAEAHAYPTTLGTLEAREAIAEWFGRRRGVPGLTAEHAMLSVGSKEFIAFAAFFLGIGEGDVIVQPSVAYPTYAMGAAFCGAEILSEDDPAKWPANTRLVWLNSPGNPDGRVLDQDALRAAVARARELGAVLIGDECYAELGWGEWEERRVPSVLDPAVTGGDVTGVLAVYSLSKQSNLAGYRASFAAGDPALLKTLLRGRKHAGLMVPGPIQAILPVALRDEAHVRAQKDLYRARREQLLPALEAWGLRIDESRAGLYLWGTRGEAAIDTVSALAELGIISGPGHFYGEAGARHVRLSMTASDEAIAAAAQRLRDAA